MDVAIDGLAARLRAETAEAHTRAERSGIIAALLRGRATRAGYALYLRNLLPAYVAIEAGLEGHRAIPRGAGRFARRELYRAARIAGDVAALAGADWQVRLPLLPAAAVYAEAIAASARGEGGGLIGHAYTRFLADLSGAQVLHGLLVRSLGLTAAETAYYAFPEVGDIAATKAGFRADLDAVAGELADPQAVVDAAEAGFLHNIAVSEAVRAAVE